MNIGKILLKANDELERRGHCKEHLELNGRVCALGAIGAAVCGNPIALHNDPKHAHIINQVAKFVSETLFKLEPQFGDRADTPERSGAAIANWNNHMDTSMEDVQLGFGIAANEWDKLHPEGDVEMMPPPEQAQYPPVYMPVRYEPIKFAIEPYAKPSLPARLRARVIEWV